MAIKHAFTSAKDDGADTTLVRPSNWNADHTGVLIGTVAVDPPSIVKTTTANVDVTVNGLLTTDKVFVQCQSDFEHGLVCIAAYCSVNDTLRLRITNWTGSAIDGASRTWAYLAYA